jgi:hypothetical protein
MSEDPLRRAFDDVRESALRRIRRPGVEAARQTLRRRRNVRLAAGLLLLVLCGVGVALNPWTDPSAPPPAASQSPSLEPSSSPTVSPSASAPVGEPSAPPCAADGRAILVRRNGSTVTVRFSPDGGPNAAGVLPCPGFKITVYLTAYFASDGGNSSNNGGTLDSTHLTASITVFENTRCVDWIAAYYYSGFPPPSVPPGSVDWGQTPPRSDSLFRDTRHNRSAILDGAHNWGTCPSS